MRSSSEKYIFTTHFPLEFVWRNSGKFGPVFTVSPGLRSNEGVIINPTIPQMVSFFLVHQLAFPHIIMLSSLWWILTRYSRSQRWVPSALSCCNVVTFPTSKALSHNFALLFATSDESTRFFCKFCCALAQITVAKNAATKNIFFMWWILRCLELLMMTQQLYRNTFLLQCQLFSQITIENIYKKAILGINS